MLDDIAELGPKLSALCRRYDIAELWVFGSTARGEDRPDSDLDVLYVPRPTARLGFVELGYLEDELASLFGKRVDLVAKNGLHWAIRDEVLSESELLYAA